MQRFTRNFDLAIVAPLLLAPASEFHANRIDQLAPPFAVYKRSRKAT
jgi:hypothetical protein